MSNIIIIKKKRMTKINRGNRGDGIVRIDTEATDILEKLLQETGGRFTVKELASQLLKYAANNTIIKIEEEDEEETEWQK